MHARTPENTLYLLSDLINLFVKEVEIFVPVLLAKATPPQYFISGLASQIKNELTEGSDE